MVTVPDGYWHTYAILLHSYPAWRPTGQIHHRFEPIPSSGGVLLLTTPNYRSYWPVLEYLIDHFGGIAEMGGKQHFTRFSAHRLRISLEANGFTVVQQGSVYHLSPFLSPLFSRLVESLFSWEVRKGGNLGPILFALARIAPTS